MLAPPHRHKRVRSPSSPGAPEFTSPLDILLKKRRRDVPDPFWCDPGPSTSTGHHHHHHHHHHHNHHHQSCEHEEAESTMSPWRREAGIERRRTRQWERLNAPPRSNFFPNNSQPSSHPPPSSPIPLVRSHSHPGQQIPHRGGQMSSSPIRHHPPSSSPFRDSSETRVEEWMDPEEMRREWGEEYATQNSLLHNLVSLHHLGSIESEELTWWNSTLHGCPQFQHPIRLSYPPLISHHLTQPRTQFTPDQHHIVLATSISRRRPTQLGSHWIARTYATRTREWRWMG